MSETITEAWSGTLIQAWAKSDIDNNTLITRIIQQIKSWCKCLKKNIFLLIKPDDIFVKKQGTILN